MAADAATTSYSESFSFANPFALAELALNDAVETRLDAAQDLNDRDKMHAINDEIEVAVTAKMREHGVDTETGEWLGEWNANDVVTTVLDRHGV